MGGGFFLAGTFGVIFFPLLSFCLNQDLRDIRDFQDGRLMCSERFSGSTIFSNFFVSLFVLLFVCLLSEPGFTGY
jgi:hypothetical protein